MNVAVDDVTGALIDGGYAYRLSYADDDCPIADIVDIDHLLGLVRQRLLSEHLNAPMRIDRVKHVRIGSPPYAKLVQQDERDVR